MINLTTAEHGGRTHTGKCGTSECGTTCNCGCPYTAIEDRGRTEFIADVEARFPNEWLAFVIPPEEDDEYPERGMLIVHSHDDNEVWDAVNRVTHNQVVHAYFNGVLSEEYLQWADSEPSAVGAAVPQSDSPWLTKGNIISLMG